MVENPRVYYNTLTVQCAGIGFIVGLIKEVYRGEAHPPARSRRLLTYLPQIPSSQPGLPVFHEQLFVSTRNDWAAQNRTERLAAVSEFFNAYPNVTAALYFRTYVPEHGAEGGAKTTWHVLPDTTFPYLVASAYQQLDVDFASFKKRKRARLPQQPLTYTQLGYFWG